MLALLLFLSKTAFLCFVTVRAATTTSDDVGQETFLGRPCASFAEQRLSVRSSVQLEPGKDYPVAHYDSEKNAWLRIGLSSSVAAKTLAQAVLELSDDELYGIVVLAGGTNENVQWRKITPGSRAYNLKSLGPLGNAVVAKEGEHQFDSRYSFFHFSANLSTGFPRQVYIIRPQDYLQFRYHSRHRPSVGCSSNIVIFTFVKWDNLSSTAVDDKPLASTITIPCPTWPLGNVLFKLCADSDDSTGDDGTASKQQTGFSTDESHVTTLDDKPPSKTTVQDAVSLMASKLSSFPDAITTGTKPGTSEGTGTPAAYASMLSTSEHGPSRGDESDTSSTSTPTEAYNSGTASSSPVMQAGAGEGSETSTAVFEKDTTPESTENRDVPTPTSQFAESSDSENKGLTGRTAVRQNAPGEATSTSNGSLEPTDQPSSTTHEDASSHAEREIPFTTDDSSGVISSSSQASYSSTEEKPASAMTSQYTSLVSTKDMTTINTDDTSRRTKPNSVDSQPGIIHITTKRSVDEASPGSSSDAALLTSKSGTTDDMTSTNRTDDSTSSSSFEATLTLPDSTNSDTAPSSSPQPTTPVDHSATTFGPPHISSDDPTGTTQTFTESVQESSSASFWVQRSPPAKVNESATPELPSLPSTGQRRTTANPGEYACDSEASTPFCFMCSEDTKRTCSVSIAPLALDLDLDSFQIHIKTNVTGKPTPISQMDCSLESSSSEKIPLTLTQEPNGFAASFTKKFSTATELQMSCTVGQDTEVSPSLWFTVTRFADYVSHKTPFAHTFFADAARKSLTVVSSILLPQFDARVKFCVLDKDGDAQRFSADTPTPSVLTCTLGDAVLPAGTHSLWAVRAAELENATYQYQVPLSVVIQERNPSTSEAATSIATTVPPTSTMAATSTSTTESANGEPSTTTTAIKKPGVSTSYARIADSLDSLIVKLTSDPQIDDQTFDCAHLFAEADKFGANAQCSIAGDEIDVRFGDNAELVPNDQLFVHASGVSKKMLLDGTQDKNVGTEYDIVKVEAPHDPNAPQAKLESSVEQACGEWTVFKVSVESGDGGRDISCNWTARSSGGITKALRFKGCVANISIDTVAGMSSPEILATVCNYIGKCKDTVAVALEASASNGFSVGIVGVPDKPVPSYRITMMAEPAFAACSATGGNSDTAANVTYTWLLNGTEVSHDSVYSISARTYQPGDTVSVSLSADYVRPATNERNKATAQKSFTYGAEPLISVVDGNSRSIAADETLTIDASNSWNPNNPGQSLSHSWTCTNMTLETPEECNIKPMLSIEWDRPTLVIPSGALTEDGQFELKDVIRDGQLSADIVVTVKVQPAHVPQVQISPMSDADRSVDGYVRAQAFVRSKAGGSLSARWFLFNQKDNSSIDVSFFPQSVRNYTEATLMTSDQVAVSFTIPPGNTDQYPEWRGLSPGHAYVVRLLATNRMGYSYVDQVFHAHSPPKVDGIKVEPIKDIMALQTEVSFAPSSKVTPEDITPLMKFGIRTLLTGNRSQEQWGKQSTMAVYKTVLSSAWPEPHAACGERIGVVALLEVCDQWGACSTTESRPFTVQHPTDANATISALLSTIHADVASGDIYSALSKLQAVRQEQCNATFDSKLADDIIQRILTTLQDSNDPDEIFEGLDYSMMLLDAASPETILKVMALVEKAKASIGLQTEATMSSRKKRSTNLLSAMIQGSPVITESVASTLLTAYDVLLGKNQDVVEVYLNNIGDLLSGFCTMQADASRIMKASGGSYTSIQAQGVMPDMKNFQKTKFAVSGMEATMTFGAAFEATYKSWHCSGTLNASTQCPEVCLGTAETAPQAATDNAFLNSYLFASKYSSMGDSVSSYYHVHFMDPLSGVEVGLAGGSTYRISIPISRYVPALYYKCFVFVASNGWDDGVCNSDSYPVKAAGDITYSLSCVCRQSGIVSVFVVNPPSPPSYPPFNEVQLVFDLDTQKSCTKMQANSFGPLLSAASNVSAFRFVDLDCSVEPGMIYTKLRPPFQPGQQTNSYAMQAIKRAVSAQGGIVAFDNVKAINVTDYVIYRNLTGDGNARRIPLRMDHSFKDIGNDTSSIASRWMKSVSDSLGISEYRLKSPIMQPGILFNFTITVPFEGEVPLNTKPLCAEEIAQMVQELVSYGELELTDTLGNRMLIDPLSTDSIIELRVIQEPNTLMLVLAIVVSTIFVLSTLCVGGLVFVKIRTDRLIQSHNENMRATIDVSHTTPITVLPYEPAEVLSVPQDEVGLDNAADTVVFGKRNGRQLRSRRR